MKPSEWSHLPNAHHIDWVLSSVKQNSDIWVKARAAARGAALDAAFDVAQLVAYGAARDMGRDMARKAARDKAWWMALVAAWDAARGAARDKAWDAARGAARGAVSALVAYDDCDEYLSMSYEKLNVYAILSEKPQAILLLPMKWVQENECLVTSA